MFNTQDKDLPGHHHDPATQPEPTTGLWTFLTNHSHVLVCLARDPELTLREVSLRVGITERATQRIVADLVAAQVLEVTKEGRRNRYVIHRQIPLRHPLESNFTIAHLLDALGS